MGKKIMPTAPVTEAALAAASESVDAPAGVDDRRVHRFRRKQLVPARHDVQHGRVDAEARA